MQRKKGQKGGRGKVEGGSEVAGRRRMRLFQTQIITDDWVRFISGMQG